MTFWGFHEDFVLGTFVYEDGDLRLGLRGVTALFGVPVHAQTSPEALVACVGKLTTCS